MKYTTPGGRVYCLYDQILNNNHTLIAGASGSGKSVFVNGLIVTILHRLPLDQPNGAQMILIDPKRVELSQYARLPHTITHATEPADMIAALNQAVTITESRYKDMQKTGARLYNGGDIFVIIEELADLMTTNRKAIQPLLQRLCQIARAARVHVICVTQCPLVKVIPTEIKVNFDSIIALRTRSAQDSRNIIGTKGAELLPKYGECLFSSPDFCGIRHHVVPYITDAEQAQICAHWLGQVEVPKPKKKRFLGFLIA